MNAKHELHHSSLNQVRFLSCKPLLLLCSYWQLRNTNTNRPLIGSAVDFSEALYYPVLYGKGPLFFSAVRNQLGDELYFAGLRQYARQHRYGIATPEDLLNTWAQVSGQDLEALYRQWIWGE